MADLPPDKTKRNRLLDQAIWTKWNRFIWSGLLLVAIGLVTIVIGLSLQTGAYSTEGLIVGLGVIVVIIGVIRLLIGIINPLSPEDLTKVPPTPNNENSILDNE